MRLRHCSLALLGLLGLTVFSPVQAQVAAAPTLMNFQGRLAKPDGTPVANGNYSLRFSLWTAVTGGTEKWNQTIASVAVKNGTFAALLNTSTGAADKFNGNLWLEINIGSDPALTPRQQLVSVAYAMKANSVPDGSIGAAQIANGSLTADKFASGALNSLSWLLGGNNITDPGNQFLGTTNNQPLIFKTNSTEKMRLFANGSLGIGTTVANFKLNLLGGGLASTAGSTLPLTSLFGWPLNAQGQAQNTVFLNTFVLRSADGADWMTAPIVIQRVTDASNQAMLSFHYDNIGIGTATPADRLHVSGGNIRLDANQELLFADNGQIRSADNNHRILFRRSENTMELREFGNIVFSPGSTGTETAKVVMRADGKVGIGTTNPTAALDVNGWVQSTGVSIRNGSDLALFGNGGDAGDIVFYTSAGEQRARIYTDGGANKLYLSTLANNAPNLAIDNLGNVGIGTATPGVKLDVNGTAQMTGFRLPTGAAAGRVLTSDASGNATWQVAAGAGWNLTGNAGTNPSTHFLGTTDAQPLVFRTSNAEKMRLLDNGNVGIGIATPGVKLDVAGEIRGTVVTITGGSDVAEPYNVAPAGEVKALPGYVVAIDSAHVGQMRVAARAYDKTVAGIISGANGINPGITLRQKGTVADGALPVASIGRVWCWCDADQNGAIEAGDMLTTSDTPGHAMKVSDYNKANGSVIGKAMSNLKSGKGLVLVLVSLK
jgi:hypothetical protein